MSRRNKLSEGRAIVRNVQRSLHAQIDGLQLSNRDKNFIFPTLMEALGILEEGVGAFEMLIAKDDSEQKKRGAK